MGSRVGYAWARTATRPPVNNLNPHLMLSVMKLTLYTDRRSARRGGREPEAD